MQIPVLIVTDKLTKRQALKRWSAMDAQPIKAALVKVVSLEAVANALPDPLNKGSYRKRGWAALALGILRGSCKDKWLYVFSDSEKAVVELQRTAYFKFVLQRFGIKISRRRGVEKGVAALSPFQFFSL